ncbi:serine hydrolase domain-containing protein [Mycolicibacterium phlei]|uniref:serine hydrolase domain-containing protein n=1 Tax=Mycolicibacterium phlei TaxID=1771 RepID=UPI001F51AF4F|nr:serine hydrolase domain-containing protein [Mycolicibacterium phlei]
MGLLIAVLTFTVAPPAVGQPADLAARLDRVVEERLAQMGVPGAIVSLSIPGEIEYVKAFGVSDTVTGAPMRVDSHHRIGSVTKTFTGTAILQLVDQGRIRLSDPISQYVEGVPSGDEITLDLLGRMRSGLPNYTESEEFIARLYRESPLGPDALRITPRELLDIAFAMPLNFPPGTQYEYSNTNTVLLGMVVEKVTGVPLGKYFQDNIFGPLGLTQTSYPANGWLPEPFDHGYTEAPDGAIVDATLWNPAWADAAGKIVSNIYDLRTWARALGSGALLSAGRRRRPGRTTRSRSSTCRGGAVTTATSRAMRQSRCICPNATPPWLFSSTPTFPSCIQRGRSPTTSRGSRPLATSTNLARNRRSSSATTPEFADPSATRWAAAN